MTKRHLRKPLLRVLFGRAAAVATVAAMLLCASIAQSAVPAQLSQQGRLLDEQGAPVTGTVEMHGDEAVCANLDDYEVQCCSMRLQ